MRISSLILFCFVSLIALGQIPSDIFEFKNGQTKKYTSDGSGKSQGLKFSIKYPQSYKAKEGDRPHVVQKFQNPNNDCDIVVVVMKLPQAYSTSEKRELLSKQSMQDMLPETAKLVSATDGLIVEGEPAGFVESYMQRKAVAGDRTVTIRAYSRMYCIVYKDFLIQITFGVGSVSLSESAIKQKFDSYKALFSYVINSFILISKWQP